ncbi:ATP-binding cassette domain-containing protein (plasmid) [Streptomyces sp. HUAS 31]|uniref:ABC transporter ATP-binding protein n=1 Tax=Streptomyces sp. HUAS 31 TaxID=3020055 RepID=UPI0023054CD6|nr:ATP-binding cassette domain-containing protein [Streptomyces sp. HUAS 31]WCE02387.1 ATP-binding cassette domain-containing protein [Streptomyces sp. HUAS 31]
MTTGEQQPPLLGVRGVSKRFGSFTALDDVSLDLRPGTTASLVGESGSGKSTLARVIMGLESVDTGQVLYRGAPVRRRRARREFRRSVGMVFQDPYESIDPRFTLGEVVAEPLRAHGMYGKDGKQRVRELLDSVGMGSVDPDSYPHKLSGGQRQRVCIARALATGPDLLVCDEPTSALDVSVQAQILNLLLRLQQEHGLAYLFITHDLDVVRRISDEVHVLYHGSVVEHGPARAVIDDAQHPYTRKLLGAVLSDSPRTRRIGRPPARREAAAAEEAAG